MKNKDSLPPGLEPGLVDSKSTVITNYTMRADKNIKVPGGIRTHNLEIRSLARYPLRHEDRIVNLFVPLLRAGFHPRHYSWI